MKERRVKEIEAFERTIRSPRSARKEATSDFGVGGYIWRSGLYFWFALQETECIVRSRQKLFMEENICGADLAT